MWAGPLPGGAGTVGRLQRRLTLTAPDDEPGDASGHQEIADADQGGMAPNARDGKYIAEEPEPLWVRQRHVQRIESTLEHRQHRRVGVDVAGQEHRHPSAKGENYDQVQ